MVKLLEFNPDAPSSVNKVRALVEEDVYMSCTPDMPVLRYAKTIPVFVWDELGFYRGLQNNLMVDDTDHECIEPIAYTKDDMLPFFQAKPDCGTKFRNVLPSSPTWNKSLKTPPGVHLTPRPVKGKIVNVNLFTLRLMDVMYNNTLSHVRRKTALALPNGDTTQAWIYTMPSDVFTKYDPHENTYSLVAGFEPMEVNVYQPTGGHSVFVSKIPSQAVVPYSK